jgi:hypothetical protein
MPLNPDPVWNLFFRHIYSHVAYWLRTLGYDLQDRSPTNLLYFIYFAVFWLAWVAAVFAFLGYALAKILGFLSVDHPTALMIQTGAFILATWALISLWQVTGRSPFVFSESDAFLLCQSPVSRRRVGFTWFLMDWFRTANLFAVGVIVMSFALTDIALGSTPSFQSLPAYFVSGLNALAIVLPLQMGLQAGLYGLGALRLRRDRPNEELYWLRRSVLPLGIGLLAAFSIPNWRAVVLSPLIFPLQAAFGDGLSPVELVSRAGLTLLILALGMTVLLIWTKLMHLGRAAQETRLVSVVRLARRFRYDDLIENIRRQNKIKATYSPSRLPTRSGVWMLVRKNLLQSWRLPQPSKMVRWVMVFLLSIGFSFLPGWTVQLIIGEIWAVILGSLITDQLRRNLAHWWLLRSLPIRNSHVLLALLGPAWGCGVLLGWLALALTNPASPFGFLMFAILPLLAASASLGSAHDILEHAETQFLMAPSLADENVPRQNIQGDLIILISVGLPLGLLAWSGSHPSGLAWGLLSLPIAAMITLFLLRSALLAYRWIK